MSIASEITRLQGVKSDILAAIAAKGVTVPAGSTLADCADLIAQIGGGPVPAYTYSLLLNWVNNVGPTPIWSGYGSDWKVLTEYIQGMNDSSQDWDQQGWGYNAFETGYFASTTVGDRLSDTRNPVDFSSYGVQGSTPFGLVSWYNAYDDYTSYYENVFSTANDGKFTIDFWYAMSTDEVSGNAGTSYLCQLNNSNGDFLLFQATYSSGNVNFNLNINGHDISFSCTQSSIGTIWHHYAITSDGDKIYMFVDGNVQAEAGLTASDKTYLASITNYVFCTQGNGDCPHGRFAQIAICSDCKWTTDFTPPTTAYVQPS